MEKKEAFLWIASSIAFVVLSVDQINKNQQIQSRASQQQQPSAQIIKATIDSGFKRFKDFLEQPLVACVIQDLAQTFIGNHKPSDGWQCVMNALQNQSR
jgi:hypothetical protein